MITRREFVKDGLAALGFLALPGGLFAAPADWKPKKKPNLVFGILSDTHLMVEYDGKSLYRSMTFDYVRNAFKLFKSRNIDLFMHLGDAAHRGAVREWEFHRKLFDSVFGKRGAGVPEKIIIVGNHELFGDCDRIKAIWPDQELWRENAICADVSRHYERVWGEPQFGKNVKLEVCLDRIDKIDRIENREKASRGKNPVNHVNPVKKEPALRVKIPMADGNPQSRVYAYNVVVMGDDVKARHFTNVFFSGVNCGIGHEPDKEITTVEIPLSELPAGKKLTIAVRPVSSLGTKGKTIGTKWRA